MQALRQRPLRHLVGFFFAVLFAAPVQAAVEAGRILYVDGTVHVVHEDGLREVARRGVDIEEGQRLETFDDSAVQVRLNDGGLVSLRGNSEYEFLRQRYDEQDPSLSEQAGELFRGFMRSVTGAVGRQDPDRVSQSSPTATIGIRGTVYQMLHVPDEGHPDASGADAGTYLFVEDGEADMTTAAGSAIATPGEVLYVPDPDSAPAALPDGERLFRMVARQTEALDDLDDEEEQVAREDEEEEEDEEGLGPPAGEELAEEDTGDEEEVTVSVDLGDDINRTVRENVEVDEEELEVDEEELVAPGSFEQVTALNILDTEGQPRRFTASEDTQGEELTFSGEFDERVLEEVSILDGGESVALEEDAVPGETGYQVVSDESEQPVSEINWGRVAAEDAFYLVSGEEEELEGDWHWMSASFALDLNTVQEELVDPGMLTGRFAYDYAGGTTLTRSTEAGELQFLSLDEGVIDVDFATSTVLSELELSGELLEDPLLLSGEENLEALYGGLALASGDGWQGQIEATLAGAGAEGIASMLRVEEDGGLLGSFIGTAAFQRDHAGLPAATGGLAGFSADGMDWTLSALHAEQGQQLWFSGATPAERTLDRMVPGSESVEQVSALNAATPVETGFHLIPDGRGGDLEINWGRYAAEDVALSLDGVTTELDSDWHWMTTSEVLSGADLGELTGSVLTGRFDYDYVGGTSLSRSSGEEVEVLELDQGVVSVDFDTQSLATQLYLSGNGTDGILLGGTGELSGLYDDQSFLQLSGDDGHESWYGSVASGRFSGDGFAGGLTTLVEVAEDIDLQDSFLGTAAFEQDPEERLAGAPDLPDGQALSGYAFLEGGTDLLNAREDGVPEPEAIMGAGAARRLMELGAVSEDGAEAAINSGWHPVTDANGELAAEINWASWRLNDYMVADDGTPEGPWHYVLGSRVIDPADLMAGAGPFGGFRYDHVGGSPLTTPDGLTMWVTDASIMADFGARKMDMEVATTLSTDAPDLLLAGGGDFGQFSDPDQGLFLEAEEGGESWFGRFDGRFAGANAEGLFGMLEVDNPDMEGLDVPLLGSLVFQQDPERLTGGVAMAGVSALRTGPTADDLELLLVGDGGGMTVPERIETVGETGERRLSLIQQETGEGQATWVELEDPENAFVSQPGGGFRELVDARGNVVAEVNWGMYSGEGTLFEGNPDDPEEATETELPADWHWMTSSNTLGPQQAVALGDSGRLGGTFVYELRDGTVLTNESAQSLPVDSAQVEVDFTDTRISDLWILLDNEVRMELLEPADFAMLYDDAGLGLEADTLGWSGALAGAFAGPGAQGLISRLSLEGDDSQWLGTLGFERGTVPEFRNLGAVGAGLADGGASGFVARTVEQSQVGFGGEGEDRYLQGVQDMVVVPEAEPVWALDGPEGAQENLGHHTLEHESGDVAGEVYWGMWEDADYELSMDNEAVATQGSWQYMMASNTLSAEEVASLPLTGGFSYRLAGSTPLVHDASQQMELVGGFDGSEILVDFDSQAMDVHLRMEGGPVSSMSMRSDGFRDLQEFYDTGIALDSDEFGDVFEGTISGAFAGSRAEGIMTAIEIIENFEEDNRGYAGAALFADRIEEELDAAVP